ncbi:MAG: ABC transporter permease, partial [Candidatus Kerfeldbacteria bacterium]|nr:ABC transporter permease [Candidatus Kerfeldbacteria bacterium]
MTLLWDNIRFALMAIWANRVRTLLTMLGIIIGVFSVITLVSIGNGVQKEFTGAVQSFGASFGAVISGDLENGGNPSSFVSLSSLTMHDVDVIATVPTVRRVAPMMIVPGTVTTPGRAPTLPMVVATNDALGDIANLTIRTGRSFDASDIAERRRVILVGQDAAASDFTGDPLGQQVTILDTAFDIVGVFGTDNALYGGEGFLGNSAPNMNAAYVVPITTTEELIETLNIFRILFAFEQPEDVRAGVDAIEQRILENHKGIKDFTVLTSDDLLELFDQFFGILTDAVAGI